MSAAFTPTIRETDPLADFERTRFAHDGAERTVYRKGHGPGVVLMHEIPGITPEVARFARRVADAGFTVFLPHLSGDPGAPFGFGAIAREGIRACISREFSLLAAHRASPITDWLRALCRAAHAELGGRGVGALGMCITGNFALALMVEPAVMAPVVGQPSLPLPVTPERAAALHLSPEELACAKGRTMHDGVRLLGLRFTHDPLVPAARFTALREAFGGAFEGIEIDSGPGNAHGIPRSAHSVLTTELIDREGHPTQVALDRTLAFFREQLA